MAKRGRDKTEGLFADSDAPARPRRRQQKALFLPRLLADQSNPQNLRTPARDNAHKVLCKWADLETKGDLPKIAETKLDALFLTEVFGALGYASYTDSPADHQLSIKWNVPGIGTADGALGEFPSTASPAAVIELKGCVTDLDRDKSGGRTAVQQAWDYLSGLPECPWAIVSNFSLIRLYHRNRTRNAYEEFSLQELRNPARFNQFYYLLERGGLIDRGKVAPARARALLEKTTTTEEEVGDKLYAEYQLWRNRLIGHLVHKLKKPFDTAIHIAQKLLDRVIFIAFCEDRGLLPPRSLEKAYEYEPPFRRAHNQKWQNFLGLFHEVDKGGPGVNMTVGYNGGLFAHDPEVDGLDLEDIPWVNAFRGFGKYDFKDEVNVDVLGHLFERSITELEKLRVGGLFALTGGAAAEGESTSEPPISSMPKSAQRKRFGIYYTPPAFTGLIVERTVDVIARERFEILAKKHKVDADTGQSSDGKPVTQFWKDCLDALRAITIVDPACGSGAFLIRAYESLEQHYSWAIEGLIASGGVSRAELNGIEAKIGDWILTDNLHGVDLSEEAVEITRLALWIRSARPNRSLADLTKNVLCGNSLVADAAVDPKALDWKKAFPEVFKNDSGFICVVGNPPWERVKVQDREFFSLTDPETAESVNASDRKKRIAAMPTANPALHASYVAARDNAQRMLDYARGSGRYPLTGKGDVNLYMLFAELASQLVAPEGLVGLLVPSGIATDDTTKDFFTGVMDGKRLVSLYDFENRNKVFPDVDGRFKFSAIVTCGKARTVERADFVFFAHGVEETATANKQRHIPLTAADMKLLNPNTRTCPIFRTRRDADLTKAIYKRVPVLIDESRRKGGNQWGIKFFTMFHQTNDAEHFAEAKAWEKKGYRLRGNVYQKGKARAFPLYEAKMVQAFDHRAASVLVDDENWVRQGQKAEASPVDHANPEFAVMPRWWVDEGAVDKAMRGQPGDYGWFMGFKDITSPTNERTMIASFIPRAAVTNKFVLMLTDTTPRRTACLLGNFNSFVFDYVTRQKIGAITLNFFIVEQLPTLSPDIYAAKCSWSKKETLEHWISERVLKLSCTAEDMIPLATACEFKGSRVDGVHPWKELERRELRAELDAAYFHLYGVEREDAEYMLSTFSGTGYITPGERDDGGARWEHGSVGEMVLSAFDALTIDWA